MRDKLRARDAHSLRVVANATATTEGRRRQSMEMIFASAFCLRCSARSRRHHELRLRYGAFCGEVTMKFRKFLSPLENSRIEYVIRMYVYTYVRIYALSGRHYARSTARSAPVEFNADS